MQLKELILLMHTIGQTHNVHIHNNTQAAGGKEMERRGSENV